MTYQEEYDQFLTILNQDTRPWITDRDIPKDGSQIYLMCGLDWQGETQYDIGHWEDYTKYWWYLSSQIPGELNTLFGNCDEIIGWKFVEEGK